MPVSGAARAPVRAGSAARAALTACAVSAALAVPATAAHAQSAPAAGTWPEWVLNPPAVAGELVGTDCVEASGNLSIDRQQVTAKARLVLAQQIEVRIEAMDETFAQRAQEGRAERLNVSFKSASRQVVNTTLQGSRLVRFEVFTQRDGGRYVCGLVALDRQRAQQLPGDVIRSAGAKVDDGTEALLLARFREAAAARQAPVGGKS
ncbi:MAG: hypothetical protein KIT17_25855 [Rubrivivax sp.]|nr:hypothetical protein [Rubrivivax sp.]